jgi:hypothetical protein
VVAHQELDGEEAARNRQDQAQIGEEHAREAMGIGWQRHGGEGEQRARRDGHDQDVVRQRRQRRAGVSPIARRLGGPQHYTERFGHPRLRARHMPFVIGNTERDQWLACMDQAMQETGVSDDLRQRLGAAFFQTADWMRNMPEA